MTKSTVHSEKDSLQKKEAAAQAAMPELFKTGSPILVDTKKLKPLSLETAGSELYAAVMNGEIHNVRGMLRTGEKVSENEATIMIRARNKAREKGARYQQMVVECVEKRKKERREKKDILAIAVNIIPDTAPLRRIAITSPIATRPGVMVDSFGGTYTANGYETADGSFLSMGGDYFNAQNNTLTLANGHAYRLTEKLDMSGSELLRTANIVQSILFSNTGNDLDFVTSPKVASVTVTPAAVVADESAIREAASVERAEAVVATKEFEKDAQKAPAAAIGRLDDGQEGLTEEALRIALHLHRLRRERRRGQTHDHNETHGHDHAHQYGLTEDECQEILQIRDGMICTGKSPLIRCHSGDSHGLAHASFNPASRHGQINFQPVLASLRTYFQSVSVKDKPAPAAAHARMVV